MFGQIIREKRKAAGMRLKDVAEAIDVSIAYLSEVERGQRAPLGESYLPKLAEVLGASHDDLLLARNGSGAVLRSHTPEQSRFIRALMGAWADMTGEDFLRMAVLFERMQKPYVPLPRLRPRPEWVVYCPNGHEVWLYDHQPTADDHHGWCQECNEPEDPAEGGYTVRKRRG